MTFVRGRSILLALFISVLIWLVVQHDDDHNAHQERETISRHTRELMSCTHQLKSVPSEHFQRELHFLVSNEDDYRSWYTSLHQRGGVYLGVGAEQNYLLAAWTRADHVILVDYDVQIHDVHRLYHFFFTHHTTLASFNRQWTRPLSRKLELEFHLFLGSWLMRHYPSVPLQAKLQWIHEMRQFFITMYPLVQHRMRSLRTLYEEYQTPTFLTQETQYQHIRGLWERGSVHQFCADVTQEYSWEELNSFLLNLVSKPISIFKVMYLSNLMQYQPLSPEAWSVIKTTSWAQESHVLYTWGERNISDRHSGSSSQYQYYIKSFASP